MKYAVPCLRGRMCAHFGHCQEFVLVETDDETKTVIRSTTAVPPPHEPGVLPRWLHELGVDVVIAGGMGARAQSLFESNGIEVLVGAPEDTPTELVQAHLNGNLQTSVNACDH
ncbi:MAG: NifB/NifX family molybdenum-iron cluster-binding protein [Spirochaetota bacterium]